MYPIQQLLRELVRLCFLLCTQSFHYYYPDESVLLQLFLQLRERLDVRFVLDP